MIRIDLAFYILKNKLVFFSENFAKLNDLRRINQDYQCKL